MKQPLQITLTPRAERAVKVIQRKGETEAETVVRILATISAIAPDFDHFFGEPSDGKGSSGKPLRDPIEKTLG